MMFLMLLVPFPQMPSTVRLLLNFIPHRMKCRTKWKMSKYEKLRLRSNKRTYYKHKFSLGFSSWAVFYFLYQSVSYFV